MLDVLKAPVKAVENSDSVTLATVIDVQSPSPATFLVSD